MPWNHSFFLLFFFTRFLRKKETAQLIIIKNWEETETRHSEKIGTKSARGYISVAKLSMPSWAIVTECCGIWATAHKYGLYGRPKGPFLFFSTNLLTIYSSLLIIGRQLCKTLKFRRAKPNSIVENMEKKVWTFIKLSSQSAMMYNQPYIYKTKKESAN